MPEWYYIVKKTKYPGYSYAGETTRRIKMVNIKNTVQVNNRLTHIVKINGTKKKKVIATSVIDMPGVKAIDTWHEKSVLKVNRAAEDIGFKQGTIKIDSVRPGQYDVGIMYEISGEMNVSDEIIQEILEVENTIKENAPKKKEIHDKINSLQREIEDLKKQSANLDVDGLRFDF